MKVVILAGGLGTRLAEETVVKPKPMVEIGGKPILWHIMKTYSYFGFNEFVIALGYKGEFIKDYFLRFHHLSKDLTVRVGDGSVHAHGKADQDEQNWLVHLIDTGDATMTGGRLGRLRDVIGNETFMLTYGDGVADVDIDVLLCHHRERRTIATLTAVRPEARFGGINFENGLVSSFVEKPQLGEGWINGGFFVLEPKIFDYIDGDDTIFEHSPLENLVRDGQLSAYRHDGFWQCMDTLRDKKLLNGLWEAGKAPWVRWEEKQSPYESGKNIPLTI